MTARQQGGRYWLFRALLLAQPLPLLASASLPLRQEQEQQQLPHLLPRLLPATATQQALQPPPQPPDLQGLRLPAVQPLLLIPRLLLLPLVAQQAHPPQPLQER